MSSLSRGVFPVFEFQLKIKTIADELATLGAPPGDEDLLICCTRGLGPAYKEVIAALHTRDTNVSFEELFDKLIGHETYLADSKSITTPPALAVNFTTTNCSVKSAAFALSSQRRLPPSTAPGLLPLSPVPNSSSPSARGPLRDPKHGRTHDSVEC